MVSFLFYYYYQRVIWDFIFFNIGYKYISTLEAEHSYSKPLVSIYKIQHNINRHPAFWFLTLYRKGWEDIFIKHFSGNTRSQTVVLFGIER